MKEEFIKYLKVIGITKSLRERIETIYEFYREICPDEITGIFVTDYITKDKEREYENLWFLSKKYIMEAKLFIEKDNFDINLIRNQVRYLKIEKLNYDFKKATEKSRFRLEVSLTYPMIGVFKASKKNCDYLRNIIFKHIMPNLQK